jgi:hypothetical protein
VLIPKNNELSILIEVCFVFIHIKNTVLVEKKNPQVSVFNFPLEFKLELSV